MQALATNQLVLGTRLHAALLAVAIGVPTVAIAYERKVQDAFVDLGLREFLVPPDVDAETLYRTATAAAACDRAVPGGRPAGSPPRGASRKGSSRRC